MTKPINKELSIKNQSEKNKSDSGVSYSEDGITIIDKVFNIAYKNEYLSKVFGDQLGNKCYEEYESKKEVCDDCPVEMAFKDGKPHSVKRKVIMPDGTNYYRENTANLIRNENGDIVSCLEFSRNTVQPKQEDEEAKESDKKYLTLTENINIGVYRSTPGAKGRFIEANPAMFRMFGYDSKKDLLALKISDLFFNPEDRLKFDRIMKKEGFLKTDEFEFKRKDGSRLVCSDTVVAIKDDNNKIIYYDGIIEDITGRKKTEERMKNYEKIVSGSKDMLALLDKNCVFLAVNDSYLAAFRKDYYEVIGFEAFKVFGSDVFEKIIKPNADKCLKGKIIQFNEWIDFPKYGRRYMEVTYYPDFDSKKKIQGFVVNGRDVTDRKIAEIALIKSEERFRLTLDAVSDGSWDWNIVTGEVRYSDRWIKNLGFSRKDVKPHISFWENIVYPEDKPKAKKLLTAHLEEKSDYYECENRLRLKSGEYRWNLDKGRVISRDSEGKPLRMVGTDTDISDKKKAEENRLRLSKLEGIYNLVITVNHEMNQPLSVLTLFSAHLLKELEEGSQAHQDVQMVENAAWKLAKLVKRIAKLRDTEEITFTEYSKGVDMINLRDTIGGDE